MQNPLLIQAIPHEDESPMSFLLRTAELNAHSSIFNLIGKEKYKSIIRQSLNYHISDMKRFTQVLGVLNLDSSYKFLAFERSRPTNRSPIMIGTIEVPHELLELEGLRYCPTCLSEKAYLRKIWTLKPIHACPIHSCLLIYSCPQCKNFLLPKIGVLNCSRCGFELDKGPVQKVKSMESVYWFLDILTHSSNKVFSDFASCWKAFNSFLKDDNSNTNENIFFKVYEYFSDPESSAIKLSETINNRSEKSHPRIQLLPFLKCKKLFKMHIEITEKNSSGYIIGANSISKNLRNYEVQLILNISRFDLEKLIDNDYLNLGKKELYKGDIASVDVERFLIGSFSQIKSASAAKIEASTCSDNIALKDVAQILDINYETARKLVKTGWFKLENKYKNQQKQKNYSKEKVNKFKENYILVGQLARLLEVSSTNLVEKLGALGVTPTNGPHIDSTAINIFLKTDVQDIKPDDLSMIKNYPTRSGRQKNTSKTVFQSTDYYSLNDAASILEISSNKVAVLVQKGILRKKENNPLSVQIEACSLVNLKNKLLSDEFTSYLDAAKQLNCPINWMKKYWCDTGFLKIEDLIYWKLIKKNELAEILKLKEHFITGAEASALLGMRHSHITNLQNQRLIKPCYFGKNEKKIRLFNIKEVLKFVIQ
ncbi:TniQ family protein [Acinetobacter chinensis]|uniref:TniQ family protein n=1 Tax=Acinetobacter chinensis TaxID=2004650 RepID=UPI002934C000|nr:TniQ family protein [Acinetobacter chinensis]WOE42358.1 TniQ family protein [Acinetobacter chinensis]